MRIAVIAALRHGLREPLAGGLERHTVDLTVQLRNRGHDVTVFASGQSDPELGVVPICPRDSQLDLSARARADISFVSDRFMVEHDAYLRLMLELMTSSFDVVHDNSLHYLPVAMARALPMPLVKVLHTPPTPWLESALRGAPDNVTVVSVSHANAALWPLRTDRVIHNAVDVDRFRVGPGDRHEAVWSGRLVPEKAPHLALEAAHLADVELLVAGPIGDASYVDRRVRPLLDARRRLVGHLDRSALAQLVGESAVALVTPAWEEPYGLVVAESLACGTPVVALARGALPELLTSETGVLVAAGSGERLAEGLHLARTLDRAACRRWAERHASLDTMVAAYESTYTAAAA